MKAAINKKTFIVFFIFFIFFLFSLSVPAKVYASVPSVNIDISTTDDPAAMATSVQILFIVAIIALAPTLLMMVTCFPRILIVLHFVRAAMGTQQMPPNQILIALALFMTFAFMGNIFTDINQNALQPLQRGEITQQEAFALGMEPVRNFMIRNMDGRDFSLFWDISREEPYDGVAEIPNEVLIPSFLLGEISKGFLFGVGIYIVFIVIDMVVASILMAMGMMMLPPAMISLPFKLLLFISIGGWRRTVEAIMASFN